MPNLTEYDPCWSLHSSVSGIEKYILSCLSVRGLCLSSWKKKKRKELQFEKQKITQFNFLYYVSSWIVKSKVFKEREKKNRKHNKFYISFRERTKERKKERKDVDRLDEENKYEKNIFHKNSLKRLHAFISKFIGREKQ